MPNWCFTDITFYSTDAAQVKRMRDDFAAIQYSEHQLEKSAFGAGFMGNYVKYYFPSLDVDQVECRGEITDLDDECRVVGKYTAFSIATMTAWDAKIALWQHIVNKEYPDVQIAYISEESMDSYFLKWDSTGLFYPQNYYLDGVLPDKNGEDIYFQDITDDGYFSGDIDKLQNLIEDAIHIKFPRQRTAGDLYTYIWEWLSENPDGDDYFFSLSEFKSIHPACFDLMIQK